MRFNDEDYDSYLKVKLYKMLFTGCVSGIIIAFFGLVAFIIMLIKMSATIEQIIVATMMLFMGIIIFVICFLYLKRKKID